MVAVLKRGLFWALLGVVGGAGCPGVPLHPDGSPAEEKCPAGAREAMEALSLAPGDSGFIYVDATRKVRGGPLVVYDGPIESEMPLNVMDLPGHTRLSGRVWTGGPRVVIRYYSARLPDGKVIPFCALADWNGAGLPKFPGRPGSAALESTTASFTVTGQFR